MLDREELRTGDLNRFGTILIGIRAYAVRRDLIAYNSRLLDYVHKGGNLIVQYQTPEFDAAPYGPYPYTMGRRPEEVSEEDAQVAILMQTTQSSSIRTELQRRILMDGLRSAVLNS